MERICAEPIRFDERDPCKAIFDFDSTGVKVEDTQMIEASRWTGWSTEPAEGVTDVVLVVEEKKLYTHRVRWTRVQLIRSVPAGSARDRVFLLPHDVLRALL